MKKRPLFWAAVCLTVIVACMIWSGDRESLPRSCFRQLSGLTDGSGVVLSGQVADCDLQSEGMRLFLNNIKISSIDNSDLSEISQISFDSIYQIYFYTDQSDFLPGDILRVSGSCSMFDPASNPGQFDAQEYYYNRNILFSLKKSEILHQDLPEKKNPVISWRRSLYRLKHAICRSYQRILGESQAAALGAITLGEKQLLGQEQKKLYQEGGISHILAISGLHISLLGMGLYRLLRRCYVPLRISAVCSACFLVSYIEMVGWSASSVRACIMFFLWLGAQLAGRAYDRLTALAAAAIWILLGQPGQIRESAFQLSFLAILSLSTLAEQLPRWLGIRKKPGNMLIASLALQAGMLPCMLYFFYQIPPWSLLINLAVVPLMSFVMGFGMLGGILGMASGSIGVFLSAPCHYLLESITQLCRLEQKLPGNLIVCGRPDAIRILLYYAVLGAAALVSRCFLEENSGLFCRRSRKQNYAVVRVVWLSAFLVCLLFMQPSRIQQMEVTCLDVGQGDGILLRVPSGEVCMIDGGSSTENSIWDYRISQTLKCYGVRDIDWWFVSHSDSDHISGLLEYLQEYKRNIAGANAKGITLHHLVLPVTKERDEKLEQLQRLASEKGIQVHTMEAGDAVQLKEQEESCILKSLAPDGSHLTGDNNQDSLVLLLQYGRFRMLFTGDLEKEGEKYLLESGRSIDADVLKVGHHGTKNASSEEFLKEVSPRVAVISCAAKNRYGHPAPETVSRLQESGCQAVCTAQTGAVQIRSDGKGYEVLH